ncbi:MAG: B12-binding domain-containing radical SAM protein, partial [Endomicrobiales bacterium]
MAKKRKLKVVLVQLPGPNLGLLYDQDNILLSSGNLKAMAYKEGLLEQAEIEIMGAREMRVFSDAVLVEAIVSRSPDLIGFSLNFRTSLRSLYVASEVKKRLPRVKVIVGGPEVTLDSGYIMECPSVDIGAIGEGEETFCDIIRHALAGNDDYADIRGIFYRRNGGTIVNEKRELIKDLNDVPSPYLLGYLDPLDYRKVYLENTRGCRNRCSYCLRAGTYSGHFATERLGRELEAIAEKGGRSVAFCDCSFIDSPNFKEICEQIKAVRKKYDVQFFGFAYAEHLTEEKADLLKECGFHAMEVGLQSANTETLRAVSRGIAHDRFVKGVKLLEERGIYYNTDIIIGLPGDTLNDFKQTLRFIEENKLKNVCTLQLWVLPGTQLRRDAEKFGIRYHKEPPYEIINA